MADNAPIAPSRAPSVPNNAHPRDAISQQTRTRISHSSTMSALRSRDIGTNNHYSSEPPSNADDFARNRVVFDQWKERHRAFDYPRAGFPTGTIDDFLRLFVPSDADAPECNEELQRRLLELAGKITTLKTLNRDERSTYASIIKLLMACQESFEDCRKILFTDMSSAKLDGLTLAGHLTGPDILGPYPGMPIPTKAEGLTWDKYAIPIEVKMKDDPVDMLENETSAAYCIDTIAQLVKNARNVLFFSFSCYVYVIGIYCAKQRMRIYRFDRSGSVSCSFNYAEKPHIIRNFLWRLVNPRHDIPNTVVGWDETIRLPSDIDMEIMGRVAKRFKYSRPLRKNECRWVRVRLDRTAFRTQQGVPYVPSSEDSNEPDYYDLEGFTFGRPLHKSSGLFSRATYVSRIIVQVPGDGLNHYYQFILKDSWHQTLRTSEGSYFKTIQREYKKLKEEKSTDLAWIPQVVPDYDINSKWVPGLAEYYGYLDLSKLDQPPEPDEEPATEYSSQSQSSQSQSSQSEATEQSSQSGDNPSAIVLPPSDDRGHSTVTSRLLNGNIASDKTRGRSLTGPLGRSVVQFKTTKNIVIAIRDAIIGHFIAKCCGVLHRDISIGNVLLAKRGDRLEGFLHDFDCASFISTGAENFTDDEKKLKDLKTMTGTHPFMAIDVLRESPHKPHHDLESFYWVLVWILLRYANHEDERGEAACTKLFDYVDNFIAMCLKHTWILQADEPLKIRHNIPLTALMKRLRHIFYKYHGRDNINITPTHKDIVEALQAHLDEPGWDESDPPLEFNYPTREDIINTYSGSMPESSTKSSHYSSRVTSTNLQRGEQIPQFVALEDVAVPPGYESQRSFSEPLFSDDLLPDYYVDPSPQQAVAIDRDRLLSTARSKPVAGTSSRSLKRQLLDDDTPRKKRRTTRSSGSEGCLED